MRSADAKSDHHLVDQDETVTLKKPRFSRKKYCTYRFTDQTVREEFVIALTNRYDTLYNELVDEEETELGIEQEWIKIKEMYSTTPGEEVLGKTKREQKVWMSETTLRLVEERRMLKAKLEAAKTRQQKLAAVKRCNEKNHEMKRSCRRDKRRRIDELA